MNSINQVVLTIFERDKVINFLDQLDQIIYKSGTDVKNQISENFTGELQTTIAQVLLQAGIDPENLARQSRLLKEEIEALPVITLTTPIVVDEEKALALTLKAREITGKPVILNFNKDTSLIGGAIVEGSGRIGEYSFRRYFQKT